MVPPALKLETNTPGGMDRSIQRGRWSPTRWPIAPRVAIAVAGAILLILLAVRLFPGSGERTVRLPAAQVSVATVGVGIFHDLIPLRASVVPRETVYVDAIDGGRVDRVLVEPGDMVRAGQPMLELTNTNLALQVIQQESQINQAISELQQNEIALEQNQLANDRALAPRNNGHSTFDTRDGQASRVRSMEGLGLGLVANHFDVVPVRTNDKSRIVVRVVVRAQTRRTIVFATRLQSRAIESFDLQAILGRERQVKMRRLLLGLVQAQRSLTSWAKLDAVRRRPLRDNSYSERFECLEEERFARCIVADSEFDVVKHEFS
jgi:multidrug efflux pump subunit AcrA (membrane-fusion protein)